MTLGGPFGRFSPAAGVAGGFAAGESPAGDFGEAFGSTGLAGGGSPAGGFGEAFRVNRVGRWICRTIAWWEDWGVELE